MALPVQITAILADDEVSVISGLKNAIRWNELGVRLIDCAYDGQQALRLILENRPDFCIIDINMPGMSGLDVMKAVQEHSLGTDFIILSGYNEFSYAQQAIRYGARGYLLKPVDADELNDQIYQICVEKSHKRTGAAQEQYLHELTSNFFSKLIDGKLSDSSSAHQFLQTMDISLSDEASSVFVIAFNNEYSRNDLDMDRARALCSESLSDQKYVLWQYDQAKLVAIVNNSEIPYFHIALRLLDKLKENGFQPPFIGIGDQVERLSMASYSYSRAMTALTYRIYNEGNILSYQNICTVPPTFQLSDMDYLPLVQHIVKRDQAGIRTFCDEFFARVFYVKTPPPNYVYSLCYALFSQIEKEFSGYTHEEIYGIANAQDLYKFQSVDEIKSWLFDTFCKLSDYVDALYGHTRGEASVPELQKMDDEIVQSAMDFISQGVNSGSSFKIDDIAQHVHLSPSYFAIYFKEKTGINLRDHILRVRMEYAAHALLEKKMTINEVAAYTGYSDYRSFSRAFKNVYDCTPSDFQSRHQ